jgi:hypothetical protein
LSIKKVKDVHLVSSWISKDKIKSANKIEWRQINNNLKKIQHSASVLFGQSLFFFSRPPSALAKIIFQNVFEIKVIFNHLISKNSLRRVNEESKYFLIFCNKHWVLLFIFKTSTAALYLTTRLEGLERKNPW